MSEICKSILARIGRLHHHERFLVALFAWNGPIYAAGRFDCFILHRSGQEDNPLLVIFGATEMYLIQQSTAQSPTKKGPFKLNAE